MKNTTHIIAMLLLFTFSAFSQTNIQWTGIASSDMENPENWLTEDGINIIDPVGNNLFINNTSTFKLDITTLNSNLETAIRVIFSFLGDGIFGLELIGDNLIGITVIKNSPKLSTEIIVNNITINNTGGIEISPNGKLTVNGDLTNNTTATLKSDASGTGSLIVKGDIFLADESSTNHFIIERWFNTFGNTKSHWHLVSAPTTNEHSRIFKGHFLNYYTETTGSFKAISSLNHEIKAGDGFIAKLDFLDTDDIVNTNNPIVFKENKPNAGTIHTDLTIGPGNTYFSLSTNFNLVGNPYTSNLDWNAMWNDASNNTLVKPTIYYYEDNGSDDGDNNGWKAYNASTKIGHGDGGIISMGQAFGVLLTQSSGKTTTSTPDKLTFKSDFQVHGVGNTFRKKGKTLENYFELNTTSNNLTDKIYFRFNENTSDSYDANYDAYKFNSFGNTPTPYFVSSDDKKLAICEMPESESVELGFVMDTDEEVTFSLTNVYDFDEIILEDKVENTFTNLIIEPYSFQHYSDNDERGRFIIHFRKSTLNEVEESVGMKVYASNNNISISANRTLTDAVVNLYNTNGQLVLSKTYSSLNDTQIDTNINSGVY
ncbi:MAG: hypothetical protein KAH32_06670, partial [Chlamydiia bacterium]|nr:hypothetical protein [Chlamydiia bacterium]